MRLLIITTMNNLASKENLFLNANYFSTDRMWLNVRITYCFLQT